MPSLSDHIDRLANSSKSLRLSNRRFTSTPAGPFSRAVLDLPLGDLIRDIDPAELGLFTLVPPPPPHADATTREEVARVEFHGATPLRKPAKRELRVEPEPEVYAEAVLRYLDKYQSIRPMPQAREQVISIIDKLRGIRDNISNLQKALEQSSGTEPLSAASLKSQVNEEERKIRDIQSRMAQLKKRKDALQHQVSSGSANISSTSSTLTPPTVAQQKRTLPQGPENDFWDTPGPSSRFPALALDGKEGLLMDEMMGDVSMSSSIESPLAASARKVGRGLTRPTLRTSQQQKSSGDESPEDSHWEEGPAIIALEEDGHDQEQMEETTASGKDVDEDEGEEGEKTVVLHKPPIHSPSPRPSTPQRAESPLNKSGLLTPPHSEMTPSSQSVKKARVRISSEMERIVAKIWSTVGEILMPGHPFDTSGGSVNKPPRAKETISLLQTLSTTEPSPASPTTSSSSLSLASASTTQAHASSAQPTEHQVLTAFLLLTLLTAPPRYSMPLNKLKLALAAHGGTGSGGTRVLYGCVAKKLVKIDRGGGEQVVSFDV